MGAYMPERFLVVGNCLVKFRSILKVGHLGNHTHRGGSHAHHT